MVHRLWKVLGVVVLAWKKVQEVLVEVRKEFFLNFDI